MPSPKPTCASCGVGDQVADRRDRGDVGLAVGVDLDEAAVDRDTDLLVTEVGRDRAAADGHQQQLGLQRLAVFQRHPDALVGVLHPGEARAELEGDAAAPERPLQQLAAGLVLQRDQVRQRLDDRHVGAEGLPDAGELDPDDAAAEDDHRRRHAVELERVVAEQHPVAVDLEAGQRPGRRPGGEHDVLARVGRVADLDGGGGDEPPLAADELDAAALHQPLQALVEPADDALLVFADAGRVDAVQRGLHAELLALPGEVGDLAGVQQRLGGDAAAVQACAAQLRLVDQHDAHVELCRTQRARVSTAAAAQDDEVDVGLSHRGSPSCSRRTGGGRLPISA